MPQSLYASRGDLPAQANPNTSGDLNHAIIAHLQEDGRMAYSEIANRLDVSEGTVRNRVNSLRKQGLLHIAAVVDPGISEYKTDAILGIKVAPGHDPAAVGERLSQCTEVVYALWVSGRYDLLIEVVGAQRVELLDFLQAQIHSHPDIAQVETMTGLKNFKNQFLLKQTRK